MYTTATLNINPFPGLRPFETEEDFLFFGREQQTDELMRRLRTHRFLAVIGTSGGGKSSLVKSGLIPSLQRGYLSVAGSSWVSAVMRPGVSPIQNLAKVLATPGVLLDEEERDKETANMLTAMVETTLRRTNRGLAEACKQAKWHDSQNLLIVVDQFEELFRFSQTERNEGRIMRDSIAFINLLLRAASQQRYPIYIIITMRSDFLGDCTEFSGLPEAINTGQYLVPRMSRDEVRQAVTQPLAIGGASISQTLLARLLNDVEDRPDQLPILQHALMRTYDYWRQQKQPERPVNFEHYEAIGTMENALSQHAEEAYNEIEDLRGKQTCERLFKALTDRNTDVRGIRRPGKLRDLAQVASTTEEDLMRIIERFRQPGRTFLMPPHTHTLKPDTVIDISHESLMRVWKRLITWSEEEARSAEVYLRLAEGARLYHTGQAGLWRDPELQFARQWYETHKPTPAWGARYNNTFEETIRFLEDSQAQKIAQLAEEERRRKAKIRRTRLFATIVSIAAIISLLLALWAFANRQKALENEKQAQVAKEEADRNAAQAEREKDRADQEAVDARTARDRALTEEQRAREAQQEAEKEKNRADSEAQKAYKARNRAEKNEAEAKLAEQRARLAQEATDSANRKANYHLYRFNAKEFGNKSILQTEDRRQKALLAITAYQLNRQARAMEKEYGYEDGQQDPEILESLQRAFLAYTPDTIGAGNMESLDARAGTFAFSPAPGQLTVARLSPGDRQSFPTMSAEKTYTLPGRPLAKKLVLAPASGKPFIGTGTGQVLRAGTQTPLYRHIPEAIIGLEYLPEKGLIVSAAKADDTLKIRTTEGRYVRNIALSQPLVTFIIIAQKHLVATDESGRILYWNTDALAADNADPLTLYTHKDPKGQFEALAYHAGYRWILAGDNRGSILALETDSDFRPATRPAQSFIRKHKGSLSALAVSPDRQWVASASRDNTVMLWNMKEVFRDEETDQNRLDRVAPILIDNGRKVFSLAFSRDSRYCLFGDSYRLHLRPLDSQEIYDKLLIKIGTDKIPDDLWNYYMRGGLQKPQQ